MKREINVMKMVMAAALFFFLVSGLSSMAVAGGVEGVLKEKLKNRPVEIHLYGVDSFGAVQLFDFLIAKIPGASDVSQTGVRLRTGDRSLCHASWSVSVEDGDVDYLQSELNKMIKNLDPDTQNDILYEAPFIVMKEDMMLLKQVKPVLASAGYVAFGYGAEVEGEYAAAYGDVPWYKQPGAGFE